MRNNHLFAAFLLSFALPSLPLFPAPLAAAEPIPLSVVDFGVESAVPAYAYLGKGLSTLLAGELRKSPGVTLIERERLNAILEEQELALSDLADPQGQVKIGLLVSAKYLVLGQMIDMAGTFIVSVRMADASTGEIVWQDSLAEPLGAYDYIAARFAAAILAHFGVEPDPGTARKLASRTDKKAEAVVALAAGVDAFDRKDQAAAKTALRQATRLDPASEVAAYYLAKLVINTTKFQVVTEPFYNYQNPAYLALLQTDRVYFGMSLPASGFGGPAFYPDMVPYLNVGLLPDSAGYIQEYFANGKLGYQLPLADGLGLQAEAMFYSVENRLWDTRSLPVREEGTAVGNTGGSGASLSLGFRLARGLTAGLGFAYFGQNKDSFPFDRPLSFAYAGNAGILVHDPERRVMFDTRLGYSSGSIEMIDPATYTSRAEPGTFPLYNENSLVLSLKNGSLFLNVKETNDLMLDGSSYYARLLPAVELFLSEAFSLRLGVEGSGALVDGVFSLGYGAVAGTTLRSLRRGLDLDLNLSYRLRPSRFVPGLQYPEFVILAIFGKNALFMK